MISESTIDKCVDDNRRTDFVDDFYVSSEPVFANDSGSLANQFSLTIYV